MNFKRLLISILSLTTIASMVAPTIIETSYSHSVYAETSASDFEYVTNTTQGYVAITGYTGSDEDIVVPETIGGYPVTIIGNGAFAYKSSIKSVTLPNTITSIGDSAFLNCSSLTSINIPNSVTFIDRGTFYGCSSLTNITIPDSVTSIGYMAFGDCSNLETATIKSKSTEIDDTAFYSCYIVTIVYDYDEDVTTTTVTTAQTSSYYTFSQSGSRFTTTTTGTTYNNNFVNGVYCDINGDGKVSTADLILIKKELLGL